MSPRFLLLALLAFACTALAERARAQEYPKLAPYPAIRWKGETPEVKLDAGWYALKSINDLPVARIVAFAKKKYAGRWQKRFDEDLVQVLTEMGHKPGEAVKLVVRDADGKEKALGKIPLTAENRRAIMRFKYSGGARPAPAAVGPKDLHAALDDFQAALDGRWSYRHAKDADFHSAIAALRKKVDAGLSPDDFAIELQKIIALGIDGHAGVTYRLPRGGCLPFLVEPEGDRFVAFDPGRTRFLADGFPYLTRIDGKPVADWCAAAAVLVPNGSPQYVRRHALRHLRDLDYVRGLMKLPKKDTVEVALTDRAGKVRKTLTLPVADRPPTYGIWPRGGSRLLDGKVGYLRLPTMSRRGSVAEIKRWMPRFRDTARLVVDVRDNGGGARDALLLLYSYLAAPSDPPRVFTAAAYRLHEEHKQDHLAARFMYRADAERWTDAERQAVAAFARTFKPRWELPEGQFSGWHYLALRRLDDPAVYHYDKPVVVLMNAKCFSATDIFLAGLKGMKNVTLLGTPSGGGSAFGQTVPLGAAPLRSVSARWPPSRPTAACSTATGCTPTWWSSRHPNTTSAGVTTPWKKR